VLSAAPAATGHPRFCNARVALDRPEARSGVFASDHRAVATTLLLD